MCLLKQRRSFQIQLIRFPLLMADPKIVTAFLKGKASALLDEGQPIWLVCEKFGVPKTTVHRWKINVFPFPEMLDLVDGWNRPKFWCPIFYEQHCRMKTILFIKSIMWKIDVQCKCTYAVQCNAQHCTCFGWLLCEYDVRPIMLRCFHYDVESIIELFAFTLIFRNYTVCITLFVSQLIEFTL